MKRKLFLTAAIALACGVNAEAAASPARCATNKVAANIEVSVSVEPGPHAAGKPIPVKVTVTNTGADVVSIPAVIEPEDHWIHFDIKDAQGGPIKYTGPEFKLMDRDRVTLRPGYFLGKEFADLRALYRLPNSGNYTMVAVYGVSPLGECQLGVHRSKTVTFAVE